MRILRTALSKSGSRLDIPQSSRLKGIASTPTRAEDSQKIAVIAYLTVRNARRRNDTPPLGTPNDLFDLHLKSPAALPVWERSSVRDARSA